MGKHLLLLYTPLQLAYVRYGSALAMAALILTYFRLRRPALLSPWRDLTGVRYFHWIASIGLITFFGSAVVQYLGLVRSTATANSLIVAIEPLFAVLLAFAFLDEALSRRQIAALALAVAGFLLLSNLKPDRLLESVAIFSVGNLFFLAVMPMEAMYTIVSRRLAGRIQPVSFFASSLFVGFSVLTLYLWMSRDAFPDWTRMDPLSAAALAMLGPVGTTLTYIYWSVALVEAPVAAVALTLFIQPTLGAAAGLLFLGERLDWWQSLGGGMILAALVLQTIQTKRTAP
jgi:drug/metabolite transporter (DMT)-like permease